LESVAQKGSSRAAQFRRELVANDPTNYLSGDAAFAVNRRGVIVFWNSEAEKLFNLPASKALGRHCWKLLSGKDMYGNRYCCERCPLMQMALEHESVHSFQALYKTASDGWKKFTINCLTIYSGNGDDLLLHICNCTDENPNYFDKNPILTWPNDHVVTQPSANNRRGTLTRREQEVLALLAEGKNTREIASLMCISDATVRNHIQHTLYKLHAHNRLEAVVTAQHLNLV
jgi:DNA-binding CsgD family transcriptional regulator